MPNQKVCFLNWSENELLCHLLKFGRTPVENGELIRRCSVS